MQTIDDLLRETTARYEQRSEQRERTGRLIQEQGVLAANDPELVEQRLKRLHADPQLVEQLGAIKCGFSAAGPGLAPRDFPRSLERVMGTNDLIGIRFLEQGVQVARAVARVQIRDGQGRAEGYGSGFLVSPRLFLTNNHVLATAASAAASLAEFNFQESAGGEMQPSQVFPFAPEEFFLTDQQRDYTLVALRRDSRLGRYGWLPLIPQIGKLMVGETVNIIQHPNGEPKQLAIRHNQVVDELELFLHYKTDTAPGSSGAPVFNDQWEVVALHHSGVPQRSPEGRILALDGRHWEEWMGEQRVAWIANEGVRISRLVAHVQQQPLSPEGRRLVEEMLTPSTPAVLADRPPAALPDLPPSPAGEALLPARLEAGVATWTIPLQVSVRFGAAQPALEAAELFGWGRPRQPPEAAAAVSAPFSLASLSRESFSWDTALSLALACQLAYEPAATVQARALEWGFSSCEPISDGPAQCFVAGSEDLVLVSFRGTESVADWLSNLKLLSTDSGRFGPVHAGFLEQFRALQQEIEAILRSAPDRRLVITGHSLGGAIAVLAAASWVGELPLHALHTFGQPMAGKAAFASFVQRQFEARYFRHVNGADVVSRVPPGYRHAGQLYRLAGRESTSSTASAWGTESQPLNTEQFRQLQQRLQAETGGAGTQEGFTSLISDHMITAYISRIAQQPVS
ncbi:MULTISPECIES: lipase family protein [unclassified Synechococcus]|uniref:lipase family protein n=1 Tax=unclassified Synechococcus TaxID=2626047 RepID=UPI0021A39E8C|nr:MULTISPECIES: trypsin-like peptidase domain-containing protein [unclassified Synechococcus]MCT0213676.1 trypsin-like peptidase domain-containing protein [Synechococcus sp. CS-1326]MCT0234107.1 trypsin-like peptidase domain-containing protein [Synechococcus sp. CS-1327]